ncbi:hypothetical protein [Succinimonas sp.]|uniref:hypothetical protein n=1 Tax=Succinimonas sp. TaxID=1936151 RepID=UPI0038681D92
MKYIGSFTLSNFGGLAIISIDPASDTCYSCFDFGSGPEHARRTQIHYTGSGRAYIRRYNRRYYFDEIIRLEA